MAGLPDALGEIPPPPFSGEMPLWKITVIFMFTFLCSSLVCEFEDHISQWYNSRKKKDKVMFQIFERVTAEFIIFVLVSLLPLWGEIYIAEFCMSAKTESAMPPYQIQKDRLDDKNVPMYSKFITRIFDATAACSSCPNGKVPHVSLFIVFLALFRVLCSFLTIALAKLKIKGWKEWENETLSPSFKFSSDPSRFRLHQDIPFVKRHTTLWKTNPIFLYIANFLFQFFRSARKPDYLTMRHGFLNEHLAPGSEFNFHDYINRSLGDDFKVILFFSRKIWASVVLFFLFNVAGFQTLIWVSLIPLTTVLVVWTKLQTVITKMAVEIQVKHKMIQGVSLVQLSDRHFWFGRPDFLLSLIHFALFQNTLQIVHSLWIWHEFGLESCIHCSFNLIIVRLCLGVGVQFWCSYNTLPLYELVSLV